jgi:hypothetical protein
MPVTPNGTPFQRTCATYEVHQQQLKDNPGLAKRMADIEALTSKFASDISAQRLLTDGTIEIPVHVNVLWNKSSENISQAQIQSQIDVLNKDFSATNDDYYQTSFFNNVKSGDTKIKFTWNPSTDLTVKYTTNVSWSTNNNMKSDLNGGISPTTPTTKLNIWVCNLSNGVLGYAQFPGGSSATDGVVILTTAFGTTGTLLSAFNKGRTATHEVGHWLNLRHIWGDRSCGNDYINDTPLHNGPNTGCFSNSPHYSTCKGKPQEMTMNYMDYTNDACMYMFTKGQNTRMQAVFFGTNAPRKSFAQP